jgi:AcrR family transcriptional regulator
MARRIIPNDSIPTVPDNSSGAFGLRERNKRDKRDRIYQAARTLFEGKGYDSTPMREVAQAADVGAGTVFLYARDKRELLLLIFQEDLRALLLEASRAVRLGDMLEDQLAAFFTPFLKFFRAHATLAPILIHEALAPASGDDEHPQPLRPKIDEILRALIGQAQQRGEIRPDLDSAVLIRAIWANFRYYVVSWSGEPVPVLREGVERLRTGLRLLMEGIGEPEPERSLASRTR